MKKIKLIQYKKANPAIEMIAGLFVTVQSCKSICATCTRELAHRVQVVHILLYA